MWNISKRGFDVYAYIILIYTFSALMSIIFDVMNLYGDNHIFKHPLGIIAPLTYCLLLTICFQPFKKFNSNKIKRVIKINENRYSLIVYIYFLLFIINFFAAFTRLHDIFLNNALESIRNDYYHGNAEFIWSSYSGLVRYIIAFCSLISPGSVLMILFFFINISILKKSIWFNCVTMLASFSGLIQALFVADRSGFIHYILIVGLCFVLFKSHLSRKSLRYVYICGITILSLLVFYLASVTISRFGGAEGGDMKSVYGSLIYYAGSSYIHFCNFFNILDMNAPFSLVTIFPLTYYLLGQPNYFEQANIVESYYHNGVSNFSTFLGMILSISGKIVMLIFVIVYYYTSSVIVYRKRLGIISLRKLIYFFIVALIVSNGLFIYYYLNWSSTLNIILWVIIARWITVKRTRINLNHVVNHG